MDLGRGSSKPGKGFTVPEAINIHDSWKEVKMSTGTRVQKWIQPPWMIEGLRTSVEEAPSDVVETELEVEPERGTTQP